MRLGAGRNGTCRQVLRNRYWLSEGAGEPPRHTLVLICPSRSPCFFERSQEYTPGCRLILVRNLTQLNATRRNWYATLTKIDVRGTRARLGPNGRRRFARHTGNETGCEILAGETRYERH